MPHYTYPISIEKEDGQYHAYSEDLPGVYEALPYLISNINRELGLAIPPPDVADVAFDQLNPPLDDDGELDPHAAASSAMAASPANASRCGDLTAASF